MPRIVMIGAFPESLLNFRGPLLKDLVAAGHQVITMAARTNLHTFIRQLSELGVEFRPYPIQRSGINPLRDLQTFLSLRLALREVKPDIVFSYTIKPIIWGGMASKWIPNCSFYALVTGLGYAFHPRDDFFQKLLMILVIRLYRSALSKASCVIFQNVDNRDFFLSKHIVNKEKCTVVNGSGVALDKFTVKPLPTKGIIFLTIGRLLGEKGFREYAKAAQIVKESYPEAVFRLVGPSDPSPDSIPDREVLEWNERGWVEYLGATNDVRPFIEDCHIYVLPSYHEGMPRTVLEAMAMGRPILTTDVPGCRATVISHENGFLVPKCDPDALAERMIWFIEHRNEWERMGARSRAFAEEKFDVRSVNRDLLSIMRLT